MAITLADERQVLEHIMGDGGEEPIRLSYGLLQSITDNFSQERVIGSGGFGVVYLGLLQNGKVAVKKLSILQDLDDKLFMSEIDCLLSARHNNIVRFLGYCIHNDMELRRIDNMLLKVEDPKRLLCFEYIPNGNLQHYLEEKPNGHVWHMQYHMIKGICEGLKNLHDKKISHMDLKPENILLGADMIPKITDFGLSRFIDEGKSKIITQVIRGTRGYMSPERIDNGEISLMSDIYALGIIVLEILTGHKHIEDCVESLDDYVEEVKSCVEIAQTCFDQDKYKRPTIQKVIEKLDEVAPPPLVIQDVVVENIETKELILLDVYPHHLRFPVCLLEPNKLMSSPLLRLTNKTNVGVAFRLIPPESHMDVFSDLRGIVLPRSTRTYSLQMTKKPPVSLDDVFTFILESCVALSYIAVEDLDDNFSPETSDNNVVHKVTLIATICNQAGEMTSTSEPVPLGTTKVVCHADDSGSITTIDVHPTEPWILASHYDGRVTIWNYETKVKVMDLRIRHKTNMIRTTAFVARERWVVSGDCNGKIYVHSYVTKEEVTQFQAHDGSSFVVTLSVHPSEPLLLSGSGDGQIKLWDWQNGWKRNRTFNAHSHNVEKLMFNPMDSSSFASVGADSTLKIWKTITARCSQVLDCQQENQLSAEYFQPPGSDRQYMITGSSSGTARIWDLKTYKCIRVIEGLQQGYGANVGAVHDCLPDRQLLITALEGDLISLYNFNTQGWENMIHFDLGRARTIVYIEGIKSTAIGFERGIVIMEIN